MHEDLQDEQVDSIKYTKKAWGASSNPTYNKTPVKIKNKVLEARIYKKKRAKSASKG